MQNAWGGVVIFSYFLHAAAWRPSGIWIRKLKYKLANITLNNSGRGCHFRFLSFFWETETVLMPLKMEKRKNNSSENKKSAVKQTSWCFLFYVNHHLCCESSISSGCFLGVSSQYTRFGFCPGSLQSLEQIDRCDQEVTLRILYQLFFSLSSLFSNKHKKVFYNLFLPNSL